MTKQEAKRYAHKVAAEAIDGALFSWTEQGMDGTSDGALIVTSLTALAEQHQRFSPKSTDKGPFLRRQLAATPLLDVADREPQQAVMPDGRP